MDYNDFQLMDNFSANNFNEEFYKNFSKHDILKQVCEKIDEILYMCALFDHKCNNRIETQIIITRQEIENLKENIVSTFKIFEIENTKKQNFNLFKLLENLNELQNLLFFCNKNEKNAYFSVFFEKNLIKINFLINQILSCLKNSYIKFFRFM